MRPLRGLQETRVATREESGVLRFPSRQGLTPRVHQESNPDKNQKTILKDTVAFVRWMNEGMPAQVGENFRVEGRARCRAVGCVQSLLLLPRKKPEAVSGTAFFPSSR